MIYRYFVFQVIHSLGTILKRLYIDFVTYVNLSMYFIVVFVGSYLKIITTLNNKKTLII